uniref:C2H2-type domain-containing protein n=1 Tax=Strongyloides papillosus TaxID=174720 RepID=A0A0N5CAD7_STREA
MNDLNSLKCYFCSEIVYLRNLLNHIKRYHPQTSDDTLILCTYKNCFMKRRCKFQTFLNHFKHYHDNQFTTLNSPRVNGIKRPYTPSTESGNFLSGKYGYFDINSIPENLKSLYLGKFINSKIFEFLSKHEMTNKGIEELHTMFTEIMVQTKFLPLSNAVEYLTFKKDMIQSKQLVKGLNFDDQELWSNDFCSESEDDFNEDNSQILSTIDTSEALKRAYCIDIPTVVAEHLEKLNEKDKELLESIGSKSIPTIIWMDDHKLVSPIGVSSKDGDLTHICFKLLLRGSNETSSKRCNVLTFAYLPSYISKQTGYKLPLEHALKHFKAARIFFNNQTYTLSVRLLVADHVVHQSILELKLNFKNTGENSVCPICSCKPKDYRKIEKCQQTQSYISNNVSTNPQLKNLLPNNCRSYSDPFHDLQEGMSTDMDDNVLMTLIVYK